MPPLSDVVGHLIDVGPQLQVRDKHGAVVSLTAADVVSIRPLSAMPVRNSAIRNLEHAAALGWPGVEHEWLDGWLLRFGHGSTRRANSAVPLLPSPALDTAAIVDWYATRGVPALLAAPDRLFRVPPGLPVDGENIVLTRQLTEGTLAVGSASVTAEPDEPWLGLHPRQVPVDVLTSVVDGEVAFATLDGAAVGRAARTVAPNGTRWVGLSSVHVAEAARRRGHARTLCESLLAWGADGGATHAYVQVLAENHAALVLYRGLGFTEHHRSRYVSLG